MSLVHALSDPAAYPHPVDHVTVVETHISQVFLAGHRVYKLKRPLDLGFVDYRTVADRERFCEEEVRLNTPWAPGVYLGVLPVTRGPDGIRVGGDGEVVDHVVQMVRLPDRDRLIEVLERGEADAALITSVAHRVAAQHAVAERSARIRSAADFDRVAANARDNFIQTRDHIGRTVTPALHTRLEALTEDALYHLRPRIEARSRLACETHGDLRLEHVYVGDPIRVLDCVEFNPALRWADPASDVAFLAMDLGVRGHRALADTLLHAWMDASADPGAAEVLPFYVAYRSAVRAKIRGLQHLDDQARRHWLFALDALASPSERPALIGIGGLPGTGKSTLSRALEEDGFVVIRSDVVRKELAGLDPLSHPDKQGYEQGLYSPEAKDRVYWECLDRALAVVRDGGRAIVDASLSKERWRRQLLDAGEAHGVRTGLLLCDAAPELVRQRLADRGPDPSDADWSVYERAAPTFEPTSPRTEAHLDRIDANGTIAHTIEAGRDALRRLGVSG